MEARSDERPDGMALAVVATKVYPFTLYFFSEVRSGCAERTHWDFKTASTRYIVVKKHTMGSRPKIRGTLVTAVNI